MYQSLPTLGGGHIFGKFTMQKFFKLNFPEGGPYPAAPPLPPIFVHVASTVDTVIFTINQGSYIIHKEF